MNEFVPANEREVIAEQFTVQAGYTGEASLRCPVCFDYIDMTYTEEWSISWMRGMALGHLLKEHNSVSLPV